ncbi:glycoside hydrolase family 32 protein [Enterococcus sp. LJL99]
MYTIEKAINFIESNASNVHPQYRQKLHLQPPTGWMNDPNGFIVIGEEIHLFYQFFPYDSVWGPMHWGHAKTIDGVHWIDLPPALAPDKNYDQSGCFSGTAIMNEQELIVMYTGGMKEDETAIQQQCIAYSKDYLAFEKEVENPVIAKKDLPSFISIEDFRDPKIMKRNNHYYALIVTKTKEKTGRIVLFESKDCIHWNYKSIVLTGTAEFGEMWECPDLIEVDGKDILLFSAIHMPSKEEKYRNLSSCLYFIGTMDWQTGTYTYESYDEIDAGLDFYAPQTAKLADGTPLLVAWMQMWDRTIPTHELGHQWAGCMTLIRKLRLVDDRLIQEPLLPVSQPPSVEKTFFYKFERTLTNEPLIIQLEFEQESDFSLCLSNEQEELLFKKEQNLFILDRSRLFHQITGKEADYRNHRSWLDEECNVQQVKIVLDISSIEVFIGDGEKTMSMRFFSGEELKHIIISSGKRNLKKLRICTVDER